MRYRQLIMPTSNDTTPLFEGVKIGKKEIEETLKHSQDFQIGIEYEVLMPDGGGILQAEKFTEEQNIPDIDKVVSEHDHMVEFVTDIMSIPRGINHIKDFFDKAVANGITFPSTAGLHASISHKHYDKKDINLAKFLVLLSGDYLHSIFPERRFVKNISRRMHSALVGKGKMSVKEMEEAIVNEFTENRDDDSAKYITTKISDYINMDGRIELRFIGGENYNEKFNEIRWQILRAIYILAIAYEPDMFRNEYLKILYSYTKRRKLPQDMVSSLKTLSPNWAVRMAAEYDDQRIIDIILTSSDASLSYARDVLKSRFKEGEGIISTNARNSFAYAKHILKGRFKKGERAIVRSPEYSYKYATDIIKGRFEKGEATIAMDAEYSYKYAKDVIKGRFEQGEPSIDSERQFKQLYYDMLENGATPEPPHRKSIDDIMDELDIEDWW